jgi:hypothetical protein
MFRAMRQAYESGRQIEPMGLEGLPTPTELNFMNQRTLNVLNLPSASCALVIAIAGCNAFAPGGNEPDDNGTQFSEAKCSVVQYDDRYGFGFDLPAGAEVVRTKNEANSLTNSAWAAEVSNTAVHIAVSVQPASPSASLQETVSVANDLAVARGAELMTQQDALLSNGGACILTVLRFDGLSTFRVQTQSNGRLYQVEAVADSARQTAELNTELSNLVLSLCVDE